MRGQLVFLDAFPESVPSLKADIMNPHFHKYYGENQPPVDCEDPIPVKFLSVEPGTVFVFRVLAAPLAVPREQEPEPVEREFGPEDEARVRAMFYTAFDEVGFGGKTSVGYGRFIPMDGKHADSGLIGTAPASTQAVAGGGTAKPLVSDKPKANPVQRETWKNAFLSYLPNTGEIHATFEGKKAMTRDKSLVPDAISGKLFGRKKSAQASVVVEPRGNAFALVEVKEG